jgi:hypothetical protein
MASLDAKQWPIRGLERSQSNTYMPLIYSVSDDFTMEFPRGYEHIFNQSIPIANAKLDESMKLPFADFDEFQEKLKVSLHQVTGTTSMKPNRHFDSAYHLKPDVQEDILNGVSPVIDEFMREFIQGVHKRLNGQVCSLRTRQTTKWHWMDDDGIPFSDRDNDTINMHRNPFILTPEGSKDSYTIDPRAKTQKNNKSNRIRTIELMGGTKRRRSKRSRRSRRTRRS